MSPQIKDIKNIEIAQMLNDIAGMLEIEGENTFRIRAYQKSALVISNMSRPLADIYQAEGEKGLLAVPGIGKGIGDKIVEILTTGKLAQLEQLMQEVPPEMAKLVGVRGLGPRRLMLIHKALNVNNLEDLKQAAAEGKIAGLPKFGEKTQENILKGIQEFEHYQGRFKLATVFPYAESLVNYLKAVPGVDRVEPTGSFRRRKELVGDLDILVTGEPGCPVMDEFVKYPQVREVTAKGDTKTEVVLINGIQVDLRLVAPESYGAGMHYFTGSQQHNIAIRGIAKDKGLKVNEYGVFRGTAQIAGRTEEEVFGSLGLAYIPPELREGQGEIEAAQTGRLPKLIELEDLRGDLHVHTKFSEGYHDIEEMAEAAGKLGYEYIAITDHSKSQGQAHGMDEHRLRQQLARLEKLGKEYAGVKLLAGIEVDILKDGSLDLDEGLLRELDVVVASVHSHFNLSQEEQTRRIIRAISGGVVNIIAHPTGRLIQAREPYDVDMAQILETARDHNVFMELNAYPDRLDLKDIHCRMAKEYGVKIAISTDSHSRQQMDIMRFGIYTARRGWLEAGDVINTRTYAELMKLL